MNYSLPNSPEIVTDVQFPLPASIKNQWVFDRADIEGFKATLLGRQPAPRPAIVELVPAARVCLELGVSRRALGRWVAASIAARAGAGEAKVT